MLKIMAESKCVLNSTPGLKGGFHERMLYAWQLGCSVVTAANTVVDGYPQGAWQEAPLYAQKREVKEHTWDVRAAQIVEVIDEFRSGKLPTC